MSKALVPKLRFPEFREPWGQVPLKEFADLVNERVGSSECVPYTVTSGAGLVSQNEKYGRTIAGKSIGNYIRLRQNDFAYNKSATKAYPEGYIARFTGENKAAVPNSIFTCFRIRGEGLDPVFLDFQFAGNLHGRWLRKLLTVGARAHGSLNVSDEDLMSMPVPLPVGPDGLSEQEKIAECLTSLDEVIAAEGRKLEALRAFKKGLLQNLFPREGETTPRLRFPEFRDAGEWKENPLGEISALIRERAGSKPCVLMSVTTGVGLVSQEEKFGRIIAGTQQKSYYVLHKDEFAFNKSRTKEFPEGFIARYSGDRLAAVPNSIFTCFRVDQKQVLPVFLEYVFHANFHGRWLRGHLTVGARVHGSLNIADEDILSIPIPMPTGSDGLVEQQRIASCLTSLDALITAQAKKLDTLKLHKQGLMQSLFPSPEDTKEPRTK